MDLPGWKATMRTLAWLICIAAAGLTLLPNALSDEIASTKPAVPAPSDLQGRVRALVKQLSNEDPDVRDNAQEALLDIGEAARNDLNDAAEASHDAQLKDHVAYILRELGRSVRPTRITLNMTDRPASEVFDQLGRQTGIRLDVSEPGIKARLEKGVLTGESNQLPLWLVVRQICEAVNLRPAGFSQDGHSLYLIQKEGCWCPPFTAIDGAFAISINSIREHAEIHLGAVKQERPPTEMALQVFAEPKVHALWCERIRMTRLEGKDGLIPVIGEPKAMPMRNGANPVLYVEFDAHKLDQLDHIEGQADFVVSAAAQPVEIVDPVAATNVEHSVGNGKLWVRDCHQPSADQWALRLDILPGSLDSAFLADFREALIQNPPVLFDDQGAGLDAVGAPSVSLNKGQLQLLARYFARGHGKPVKLKWDLPTRFDRVTTRFRFADVPLP